MVWYDLRTGFPTCSFVLCVGCIFLLILQHIPRVRYFRSAILCWIKLFCMWQYYDPQYVFLLYESTLISSIMFFTFVCDPFYQLLKSYVISDIHTMSEHISFDILVHFFIDGLVQDCGISSTKSLEIPQPCIKPLIYMKGNVKGLWLHFLCTQFTFSLHNTINIMCLFLPWCVFIWRDPSLIRGDLTCTTDHSRKHV